METSRKITIEFVIGLMINIVSMYLFNLGLVTSTGFLIIFMGFLIFIIISDIQSKNKVMAESMGEIIIEQKKLNEKLKIYERLAKLEEKVGIRW